MTTVRTLADRSRNLRRYGERPVHAPPPTVSIAIPTRDRAAYLDVALRSLGREGAEVLVVVDGPDPESAAVATR
ncbi:MAG: hypothetical protein JWP17_1134, partial [Solirubrobacterales bacterium]|nr:hypothetical protein [Solirubrobacterales bacterium]